MMEGVWLLSVRGVDGFCLEWHGAEEDGLKEG